MKYYLPTHCDGGNRGCEAITKATSLLLGNVQSDIHILTKNSALDRYLSLNEFATLHQMPKISRYNQYRNKFINKFISDSYSRRLTFYKQQYASFLNNVKKNDILLSTGGDMFCYDDNEAVYTSDISQKNKLKTILWGCSIGSENLSTRKIEVLKKYSLIYARESLTKNVLDGLGIENVCVFPDPAFILEPVECDIPSCFSHGDVVGFNLSSYILDQGSLDSLFGQKIISLIDHILESSDLNLLLIPHVLWSDQDDRVVSSLIVEKYKDNSRISILDSSLLNYCQIRYIISLCRYFIGARTHAVISSYSTCVPTIALGYSIKSKGIAKDMDLPPNLVVDCKKTDMKYDLIDSYDFMVNNEKVIKDHLLNIVPKYVESVYGIRNKLKCLF
jgi:polysaccharide pyruvyl transferase WcaK-like protein